MNEENTKIDNFLSFIEKRIIEPINKTDISESCTATLLLIFAAIDSLSKITCVDSEFKSYQDGRKGVGIRFKGFLKDMMDTKYDNFKVEIYNLRNDIVHTGINAKVFLSKDQQRIVHLKKVNGYLWINTKQFFDDFTKSFERIKIDMGNRGEFYINAKKRLRDFDIIKFDGDDIPTPSAGPDESTF